MTPRTILRHLFDAALAAAAPERVVDHLPAPPAGRTIVVGAGKAVAAMARAVEDAWPETAPLSGLVVTRRGQAVPTRRVAVAEASHPDPSGAGARAALRQLALVAGLGPQDLVLALISGGGSALLGLPAPGLSFDDFAAANAALLRSGAPIGAINVVRKHLSAIAGGKLALAAAPAPVLTLAISDVPGDAIADIASGPTLADPSTLADARAIVAAHGIALPPAALARLSDPDAETPKRLAGTRAVLVARPVDALRGAADAARALGLEPLMGSDRVEGEARAVAADLSVVARSLKPGQVHLSGGEVTVTGAGGRPGGPNRECALALALALQGAPGLHALLADTDGIDGSACGAGAFIGPDSLARAAGRDLVADLDAHASGEVFAALGDDLVTGPTFTNVNDFRAILRVSD